MTSNLLSLDWDVGATSTVPFDPSDPWSGPIAALSWVADGAAAMELDLIRCENWEAMSVEFNAMSCGKLERRVAFKLVRTAPRGAVFVGPSTGCCTRHFAA